MNGRGTSKLLAGLMALVLALALVACGGKAAGGPTSYPESSQSAVESGLEEGGLSESGSQEVGETAQETADSASQQIAVELLVECSKAEGYEIPCPTNILEASLSMQEGDTVYTALMKATQEAGVPVVENAGYVKSIAGLSAGDCGPMSGWTYLVNGEAAMVGCTSYSLKDGDRVQWSYIVEWK